MQQRPERFNVARIPCCDDLNRLLLLLHQGSERFSGERHLDYAPKWLRLPLDALLHSLGCCSSLCSCISRSRDPRQSIHSTWGKKSVGMRSTRQHELGREIKRSGGGRTISNISSCGNCSFSSSKACRYFGRLDNS